MTTLRGVRQFMSDSPWPMPLAKALRKFTLPSRQGHGTDSFAFDCSDWQKESRMLGKLAELFIFGLAPLVLGGLIMPGAIAAEEITVTGEVSYRERIALPPNAVLTVRLLDVSLADAPETVVGEQKIEPAGQVPIKFEIKFSSAVVQPNASYALQARIMVDNQLWFINDERYAVDPLKPEPAQMVLKMVKQNA